MGLLYLYMYIYHKNHQPFRVGKKNTSFHGSVMGASHEGTEAAEKNTEMTGDPLNPCNIWPSME